MPTILCADDDPAILKLYDAVLKDRGYTVLSCTTGTEVIEMVRTYEIDLFILDLVMVDVSGFDMIEVLRSHPRTNRTPIVVVSGRSSEEEIVRAITLGADDFLLKPVRNEELLAKIAVSMARRHVVRDTGDGAGLQPGVLLADRYRIVRHISSGGFAKVYGAIDITDALPTDLAIKVFEEPVGGGSGLNDPFLSQLLREAASLVNLDHPNIIRMYDFGQSGRYYFLVMEYAQGQPLDGIVEKRGALPEPVVALIGCEVASALSYLSRHRIVHRDVKPDNIMITEQSELKLIDFGLAKIVGERTTIGASDEFQGSAGFVSPEMIEGREELDVRSDIYSLGVTLYFAATGVNPFQAENHAKTLERHLEMIPLPANEQNPDLSDEFSMLLDSMLAKHRDDRPDLENLLDLLGDLIQ